MRRIKYVTSVQNWRVNILETSNVITFYPIVAGLF